MVVMVDVYTRLSRSAPVTADSANAMLQGDALMSGDFLLRGWTLSGASFYGTDLIFYAAVGAARGVSTSATHEVGAVIYTLVVVAAAFLARGQARGWRGAARMLITTVLLLAPMPGEAVQLILLGPFHVGTTLLLLLALLFLDKVTRSALAAVGFALVLAVTTFSDPLAIWVGALPVIAVSLLRLAGQSWRRSTDVIVTVATAAAILLGQLALGAVRRLGGFETVPLNGAFAQMNDMPKNLALTIEGLLMLFGADFFGEPLMKPATLLVLVHLVGFLFVLFVAGLAAHAWRQGREADRVNQVLLAAMALDAAAYLFSNQAIDHMTARYLIPFMAFGAVLAGRLGADWIGRMQLAAPAALVGLAYVGSLLVGLGTPAAPRPASDVGPWLEQRKLRYGLAAYWQASTVTVDTEGRVQVRAVTLDAERPSPYWWEAEQRWYDPRLPGNDARFVLRDTSDSRSLDRERIIAAFGPPTQEHRVGRYDVMVWDRNLLTGLAPKPPPGDAGA